MKIAFHGAARAVTGSKHLLTLDNGRQLLFDCGLFQGMGPETDAMNAHLGFDAAKVDYLLLSHAHMDHSGLLPLLVRQGFKGRIFCTAPTYDLAAILLQDSAEIQQSDARFVNKKRAQRHQPPLQPLYTQEDVAHVLPLMQAVPYGEWIVLEKGLELLFTDAGHIIGSAAVHVRITGNDGATQVSFSGDVGRYRDIILRSPEIFPQADYLLLESTYGNSLHEPVFSTPDQLLQWVRHTCVEKKGKLLIPAFSVGRTQELLYFLNQLSLEKRLPPVPVFVDSPLGKEVTDVVKKHPASFNQVIQQLLQTDDDPFGFAGLHFTRSVEESKQLNTLEGPCIIVAGSGMADAGRIKHHIMNHIGDARNTVLLVGYCEPSSLGGKLANGAKEVSIYGERLEVVLETGILRSMSAHGDYEELLRFLSCQQPERVKKLFLVHGEYPVQQDFKKRLEAAGFTNVAIPERHQVFEW